MLKYETGPVPHNERCGDMERIQRAVGPSGKLFREIFGHDRKAEHGRRADRRNNGPLQI
jgi:hypothetical protein